MAVRAIRHRVTTRLRPFLWVDPVFSKDAQEWESHRVYVLTESAVALNRTGCDFAAALGFTTPTDDRHPTRCEDFRTSAVSDVHEFVGPLLSASAADAAATLAGVFSTIGAHSQIVELADHLAVPAGSWRAWLHGQPWLAGAHTCLDNCREGHSVASRARRAAIRHGSPIGVCRAWIASAYAATAEQSLRVLPRIGRTPIHGRLSAFASVFFATAAVFPVAAWAYLRVRNDGDPDPDAYSLVADYLEHWVRLGALLNRLRGKTPGANGMLNALWRLLEQACRRVGYTVGVLNVGRFRDRVEHGRPEHDSAITRAELIGHPIGLAIAHRDAAEARLRTGNELAQASDHLDVAMANARRANSSTLILKIAFIHSTPAPFSPSTDPS